MRVVAFLIVFLNSFLQVGQDDNSGNSNSNKNVSQTAQDLKQIFTNVDSKVIESVLRECNNDVDAAVDKLSRLDG